MTMTTVQVFDSAAETGRALERDIAGAQHVSIAVAFAKPSAWQALDLREWCRTRGSLRLVVGTDFEITDLDVLRDLSTKPNVRCKVMHSAPGSASFHPKLYLIKRERSVIAFVGSSNLTLGGLRTNVEANVRIEGEPGAPPIEEAQRAFDSYFEHELATPLSPEFEARYSELRALKARAQAALYERESSRWNELRVAERLLLGEHRAQVARQRWLLVTTENNHATCMRTCTWGRQNEHEARAYAPGDVFFFHVTGRSEVLSMGMFTGQPYFDPEPMWKDMDGRGSFPWRMRFIPLGELRVGVPTKATLESLRPNRAPRWFNGFIQASHGLTPADFSALRMAFEQSMRTNGGLGMA